MQKIFRRSVTFAVLMLLIFSSSAFAVEKSEENSLSPEFIKWQKGDKKGGVVPFPFDFSHLKGNPPNEKISNNNSLRIKSVGDSDIPSTYDLRDVSGTSYVTSVKNQSSYNTCWAFSAIGAMESNVLKRGGSEMDLSEMHLAWFTFRNSDKSKAFKNLNSAGLATVMAQGGHSFYPAALYGRLGGPAYESELEYVVGGSKPSLSTPEEYTRALRLREIYYLNFSSGNDDEDNLNTSESSRNIIKRRIMESGAVVANYDDEKTAYYKTTSGGTSFYTTGTDVSHAVQIIGWDDNYSKDNFKTKPSSNGAWLIKNSWSNTWSNGTSNVGDNGCFWMSYEQFLTEGSAYITEDANNDMNVYYYDALGWTGSSRNYSNAPVYFANVFKSEREDEYLTEVAFYTPDNNINYEINVYKGMSSMPSASPINGSSVSTTTGTIPYAGYHTVTLDEAVELTNGEYFSVVVKFNNCATIPTEKAISDFSQNASIETGSFISGSGSSWTTGSSISANVCVKAFTLKDSAPNIAPTITTESLSNPVIGVAYSQKISATGSRPITWSISGTLPSELTFDTATGTLSGTPTSKGEYSTYTFTITATNANGSDSKSYTIKIVELPTITTTEFTGYAGYAFSETLELSEGTASQWSVTGGTMPRGLSLEPSTGVISGKPSASGTSTVTFTAVTTAGSVWANVKIIISAKPTKPKIKTSKLEDGFIDTEYSDAIEVYGTKPITLSIEGQPEGLSFDSSTGVLSGTPTEAGLFTMTVTAENIYTELNDITITKKIKLKINAVAPVIASPSSMDSAILGEEYSGYQFSLSSGTEPVTWSASSLPRGMTLSEAGYLSGTPTKAGNFNINLKVFNVSGKASLKIPFTVYEKPTITTTKLSDATAGKKYTTKIAAKGTGPISWNIDGLPDTLSISLNAKGTTATITGTPTVAENYTLNVTASNSAGSDNADLEFNVKGVAPKIKASLAKGKVDTAYTGSKISATGTLPIDISYSILDSDQIKFGISSLSDLGLTFTADSSTGTAEITGTPTKSIKNLPIYLSANNAATSNPVTKRVNFTATGTKPAFTDSSSETITQDVDSAVNIDVTVTGTKDITITMTSVSGLSLTQTGDYTATISGTAPSKVKKLNIKVTASNADGKATKKITLQTRTVTSETANDAQDISEETQNLESEMKGSENETSLNNSVVKLGTERDISSLKKAEADALKDYTVAAVLPEISVSESGMYDFEVDISEDVKSGEKLFWFAFPQNREKIEDDEIAEFYDTDGAEIENTPENHEILISVWLNSGDIYAPVIAVKEEK